MLKLDPNNATSIKAVDYFYRIFKKAWKKIFCPICNGSGKASCNCKDGLLSPDLEGASYGSDSVLSKKEGNYFITIRDISVRNKGISGSAELKITAKNRYSGNKLFEHVERVRLINGENRFENDFVVDLGDLNELRKLVGREPESDDILANVSFNEVKPKFECPKCNGKGKVDCWKCGGKRLKYYAK